MLDFRHKEKEREMEMYRKTTCKGCGYTQETLMTYRDDRKHWESVHTLEFCKNQKAFNAFYLDLMAMA